MVRVLYAVERQARDASVPERLRLRQQQSAPVLAHLREKLLEWKELLLPKHPMAEAIHYALGQWMELNVFCTDGAVAIDNNRCTAARGSGDVMPTAELCRAIGAANGPVCNTLTSKNGLLCLPARLDGMPSLRAVNLCDGVVRECPLHRANLFSRLPSRHFIGESF